MSDPSRFGPLTRHLADVALVVDREGHLLEASPDAGAALGWSEELAPDHWVIEVLHPDDQGRVIAQFSALQPGETGRTDARLRMPDTEWRWHELIVTDLRHDPAVGGVVVAAHDIAARKADELDLQRSEAYITSLVQHASDTILVLDAMVRIRYASPSVEQLVGRTANHLLGTNVLDLVHPDDLVAVADAFLEAAHTTGQTAYLDFRLLDSRGVHRHVEAAATNLLDHPATNGIVVNVRDLADRDRAREVIERSERRFRKLIAHISDTITLVDAEGRVMMVTGAAREILGYPGEYWPGQNVFDIVHPEDQERVRAFQNAVLDQPGGEVTGQFRAMHADGSWIDLEITVANLLDDPDVGGGVITSRNISSHKSIERALSDATKQALDALAAKAEFVAQVGHEVRTPIHGIIGLAEVLGEARLDDESRRLVEAIRRSGEGLGMVINDLLDFSKMEAGRLELVEGVVSPHRLVSDVVEMLRPQADVKNVALVGSLDAQVPVFVRGDEHRLRQVLVNLMGNAVKYTDQGSVAITVETVKRMGEACVLRLAVTDTGVGIPADEIDLLFDPFTQASTTASLHRPGTGLGLTITRQLVELMGGEVNVTSQVGKGSTFTFDLPTVALAPEELPRSGLAPAAEVLARGPVPVVEDSPVNQALVERQLVRLGCEPVVASGGVEALGLMEELAFDLVLMDWQMPGIDGLETTRRWREMEGESEERLPIVAMTASAMPGARAECLAAGMDGFLAKPVKLDDLATVLERYLAVRDDESGAPDEQPDDLVDYRVLETLAEEVGDPAIAARVVTTFLGELDGRLAALRASTSENDRETLQRTAHTLKSTSRALGADALAEVCADLELRATEEDLDPGPLVDAIMRTASGSALALREQLRLLDAR